MSCISTTNVVRGGLFLRSALADGSGRTAVLAMVGGAALFVAAGVGLAIRCVRRTRRHHRVLTTGLLGNARIEQMELGIRLLM